VFNRREDYIQRIFIHFKAQGYADSDYYDSKKKQYAIKSIFSDKIGTSGGNSTDH